MWREPRDISTAVDARPAARQRTHLRRRNRAGRHSHARLLLELSDRFTNAAVASEAIWIVPMRQADLAEWLGATRETTARSLGTLRRAGLISTGRNCVTVHDRTALAVVARQA